MSWKTSEPPKDGTPIVACGRILSSFSGDPEHRMSDPFCAAIFWRKESDWSGWLLWLDEHHLVVASGEKDEVKIDRWLEYPK